jgi:predicted enzyme related to lactoylglutathione lyase
VDESPHEPPGLVLAYPLQGAPENRASGQDKWAGKRGQAPQRRLVVGETTGKGVHRERKLERLRFQGAGGELTSPEVLETRRTHMADTTAHGRFVWHELITPDAASAHDFYSKAVGWRSQTWEHDPSYSMFVATSGPLGAAVEKRDEAPHWLNYIGVADVDATVAAAVRLGAWVLTEPADVPNAGRSAVLADPQGAAFAVHSSTTAPTPERAPTAGEFSWHELATSVDPAIAFAFYAALFGWDEVARHDMGPMGVYLVFGRDGLQRGGMFNKGETGRPGPAYWVGYVSVPDLDRAVAEATAERGVLLHGPSDVPDGDRIAQLMDPHGALFAVHWSRAESAEGATGSTLDARRKSEPKSSPAKRTTKKARGKPGKKTAKKAAKKVEKKATKKKTIKKKTAKKARKKTGKKTARRARKAAKKARRKSSRATKRSPAKKKSARKSKRMKASTVRKRRRRR